MVCRVSVAKGPNAQERRMLSLPQGQVCAGKWTDTDPRTALVLRSTPVTGNRGKQDGQREFSRDVFSAEDLDGPMGILGVEMTLQSCPQSKQEGQVLYGCIN